MTKKTTKKGPAKKRAKKTTAKKGAKAAANDAPDLPPLPPSMPGQQEHIPETLDQPIPDIQDATKTLNESRKAAAGWGRQVQMRKAVLESELKKHDITTTYYDGVVRIAITVPEAKEKLEVEVVDAHFPEAAE